MLDGFKKEKNKIKTKKQPRIFGAVFQIVLSVGIEPALQDPQSLSPTAPAFKEIIIRVIQLS
jgi:hypothetical protein